MGGAVNARHAILLIICGFTTNIKFHQPPKNDKPWGKSAQYTLLKCWTHMEIGTFQWKHSHNLPEYHFCSFPSKVVNYSVHILLPSAVGMTHVSGKGLWWVMLTIRFTGFGWNTMRVSIDHMDLFQTHCKQVPDFSCPTGSNTHIPSLQFLPTGQYGFCFGYSVSGSLTQRSNNRQVTSYWVSSESP